MNLTSLHGPKNSRHGKHLLHLFMKNQKMLNTEQTNDMFCFQHYLVFAGQPGNHCMYDTMRSEFIGLILDESYTKEKPLDLCPSYLSQHTQQLPVRSSKGIE